MKPNSKLIHYAQPHGDATHTGCGTYKLTDGIKFTSARWKVTCVHCNSKHTNGTHQIDRQRFDFELAEAK